MTSLFPTSSLSFAALLDLVGPDFEPIVPGHEGHQLFSVGIASVRARYLGTDFGTSAWLPLYEIERRGWDVNPAFAKIGTADDHGGHYAVLRNESVEFYLTDADRFSVTAFEGWNLTERSFQVRQLDPIDLDELMWADGRDIENYE